jgi:DNA polymerase-3 subunit gamma/tau
MSYIVLARKWRPRGFNDLIGQETLVKTLQNAISSEKIVHAYLFSGPRGVGKTSTARILAKALNCQTRTEAEPCGTCQSCRAITEGSSVDVFEIDGASNTSVDAVRELREAVKYAPSGGKYKIYIIDEVHMLSTAAFNALLKTLEEPPPHVIFIFATTEPKKIPATILSRCQHHSFRRISRTQIREHLKKITDTEQINIDDSALDMIARAADGSMRDSLTLLDQASSFSDHINEKELHSLLGLPETEVIANLSETILKGDIANTLAIIKDLTDRGSDLRQLTKELVEHFRNLAVVKVTEEADKLLEFSEDDVQILRRQTESVSIEQLTLLLTELLRLEGEVRNAINPRYTIELGLLRTSFVKGMTSIDSILKHLGETDSSTIRPAAKETSSNPSAGHREKKTAPPVVADNGETGILPEKDTLWKKVVNTIDAENHLLSCKLLEARVISLKKNELSIGFNGGMSFLAEAIRGDSPVIESALARISGQTMRLKIKALPKEKNGKNKKEIKDQVFAEPIVQDAIKMFNGSMVTVKSLEEENQENKTDQDETGG